MKKRHNVVAVAAMAATVIFAKGVYSNAFAGAANEMTNVNPKAVQTMTDAIIPASMINEVVPTLQDNKKQQPSNVGGSVWDQAMEKRIQAHLDHVEKVQGKASKQPQTMADAIVPKRSFIKVGGLREGIVLHVK